MIVFKRCCLVILLCLTACATQQPSKDARDTTPPSDPAGITLQPSRTLEKPALPFWRRAKTETNTETDATGNQVPLMPITAKQTASRTVVALNTPVDLWDRIRRGYAMPNLDNDLVRDREQWYAKHPDYISRMTERSRKYLFHIVEELELRNMPTELALLPFVESAFNPQAVSSARAVGIWQFMPATGRTFELKQNAFRDDRRDVLASTRAALDYLHKLYGMFGDWHLALAAYNWGEGSVGRAVARNQRAGLALGYSDLSMPMETRFYIPKLQAIKNIVSQPTAFGNPLPVIENHPYFQSVTIHRDIDVALAARLAEVSLDDFKALNPSLNRPVIMAAGTPQILLPWDNAEIFQSNLESYGGGRLASWTVWLAPMTMHPAEAARRVGMSEAELRSINAIPPRVVIQAGSALLVPRSPQATQDIAVKVADNGQLSLAPEIVLQRVVLRAKRGESVASVARKHRVRPDQVSQWNKIPIMANFKPGQQVVLFLPSAPRNNHPQAVAQVTARAAPATRMVAKKTASRKVVTAPRKTKTIVVKAPVRPSSKHQTTRIARH
ncbi:MAG: transglycosylase SLT domain-containing protein [Rhodoferax sp.]|nr:transglycosylase SLT domain-containing protein [Rhodoferax sp.]